MIDFKASLLWVNKFVDLRKLLETNKNEHETIILNCWELLHSPMPKYSRNIEKERATTMISLKLFL